MADHKHGSMEIKVQEDTFDGFIKWCTRVGLFSIGFLVFLAVFNS